MSFELLPNHLTILSITVFEDKADYNSVCSLYVPESCTSVFGVEKFNGVMETCPDRPVATVTKIFAFCHELLASTVQGPTTIRLRIAMHSS